MRAVASAAPLLDQPDDRRTTPRSSSPTRATSSSRWAARGDAASTPAPARSTTSGRACQHFELYDDVPGVLRSAAPQAVSAIGLISNSHRCLASFQSHFELRGPDRRRRFVVRARVHEAAPEHLRGGAADSTGVGAGCSGDGGRQRPPRHRRRAARRHARRCCCIAETDTHPRGTRARRHAACRSSDRCASCCSC